VLRRAQEKSLPEFGLIVPNHVVARTRRHC
jgi:hypothetical protein